MLFRWDPCGILCVLLTYGAILYADYVLIFWLVSLTFQESLWGVVHVVLFNVLLFMVFLSHCRAMMSDPGIVPLPKTDIDFSDMPHRKRDHTDNNGNSNNRDDDDIESDVSRGSFVGEDWTVCGRCEAYRPPRAHHCRICKRCVRKMDHHCPWINNCVGEFNQKYFIQFLLWVAAASAYCIGVLVACWMWPCMQCKVETVQHARVLHTIFVSIECTLFFMFVLAVSCDQLSSIFNDETAVEHVQRRGSYRTVKSKKTMLREVCGPGPVMAWALPCHSLPTNKDFVVLPSYYNV